MGDARRGAAQQDQEDGAQEREEERDGYEGEGYITNLSLDPYHQDREFQGAARVG